MQVYVAEFLWKVISWSVHNMPRVKWGGAFPAPLVINSLLEKGKHTSGGLAHCWQSECPHLVSAVCRSKPAASPYLTSCIFFPSAWQEGSLLCLPHWLCYRCFLSAVNTAINKAAKCLSDYNYWPFAGYELAGQGLLTGGVVVCLHWHNVRAINTCATLHKWSSTWDRNWIKRSGGRSLLCSASRTKINILISMSLTWDTSLG